MLACLPACLPLASVSGFQRLPSLRTLPRLFVRSYCDELSVDPTVGRLEEAGLRWAMLAGWAALPRPKSFELNIKYLHVEVGRSKMNTFRWNS